MKNLFLTSLVYIYTLTATVPASASNEVISDPDLRGIEVVRLTTGSDSDDIMGSIKNKKTKDRLALICMKRDAEKTCLESKFFLIQSFLKNQHY